MQPFLYMVLIASLSQVMTAGRLIDSRHFTRDRFDKEVEEMLCNPWIARGYKVGLLQDLVFDLQEYAADRNVGDRVFNDRLEAFELGCFVLDPTEKEVEISEQDFAAFKARRARTVRARKRHQYQWFDGLIQSRDNNGGSR